MKMAGRMGQKWRQVLGLKIWRMNTKYNVLYVQGPTIPGPTHCYVRIVDSCLPKNKINLTQENHPPFPTFYADESTKLEEDIIHKEVHKFSDSTITFEDFEVKKFTKREGAKLAKIKN
jgi:large subunit ribosomal protein L3